MEAKFRQSLLSIRLVEAIYFYIAQIHNNGIAVLNKVRSSERRLVAIIRAARGTLHNQKMNNLENWMD